MRLTDLTSKFLDFVAGNLRRLAEILSLKAKARNGAPDDDIDPSPRADWFETTRHIPPEQWVDFSGQSIEEKEAAAEPDLLSEGADGKTSDQTTPKSESTFESFVKEASLPKSEAGSHFLTFKVSDKTLVQNVESVISSTETLRERSTENEKLSAVSRQKNKVVDFSPVHGKRKRDLIAHPTQSPESPPHRPEPAPAVSQRKSAPRTFEHVSERRGSVPKETNRIVTQPVLRKEPTRETPSTDLNEAKVIATSSGSKFPTPPPTGNAGFARTPELGEEVSAPFSDWRKKTRVLPGALKRKDTRRNDEGTVSAAPPWIDLPDDFLPDLFEEIASSRSETEHLLYLEREQAGEN